MNHYFLILATLILFSINLHASNIKAEVEDIIHEVFPDASLKFSKQKLPEDIRLEIRKQTRQKFFTEHIYIWQVCQNDSIKSIAILDNVPGKSQPISFLLIISKKGIIERAEIIRYREPYGGAVAGKKWLDQFKGLSASDDITVGRNIDAITGATISVASVTTGIQKLLYLWDTYLNTIIPHGDHNNSVVERKN